MRQHDRQERTLIFVGQLVNKLLAVMETEGPLPCQDILELYCVLNQFNN